LASHARAGAAPIRRPTNVSLPVALLEEARSLGIAFSSACERGLAEAVAREKSARWIAENADALRSSNDFVERHGLPLSRYRRF
jgi:antitoxin CcdA